MNFQEFFNIIFKPFIPMTSKFFTIVFFSTVLTAFLSKIDNFSTAYLGISGVFMATLSFSILADFVTGILAAKYNKEKITSRKGFRIAFRTGAYLYFIHHAFSLGQELEALDDTKVFYNMVKYMHIYLLIHVSFWEMFSIDENLKRMNLDLKITHILTKIKEKFVDKDKK